MVAFSDNHEVVHLESHRNSDSSGEDKKKKKAEKGKDAAGDKTGTSDGESSSPASPASTGQPAPGTPASSAAGTPGSSPSPVSSPAASSSFVPGSPSGSPSPASSLGGLVGALGKGGAAGAAGAKAKAKAGPGYAQLQMPNINLNEEPPHAAARLREDVLGKGPIVCILGGTTFINPDSEALTKAIAKSVSKIVGKQATFVTGGMAGVQKVFAENCSQHVRLFHLLPMYQDSNFSAGIDLNCGRNLEERKKVFGQLGDVYLCIEGGPGVSGEAKDAYARDAQILPIIRSGGASGGMFDFPSEALEKPETATEEQWDAITSKEVDVAEAAEAAAQILAAAVEEVQVARQATTERRKQEDLEQKGAPAPIGVGPMKMTNDKSLKKAFDMLDTDKARALTREQAKKWLRCVGWTVPTDALEDMLDGGTYARKPDRNAKKHPRFTRMQLLDICANNQDRPNGSIEKLTEDVKHNLNGGQQTIKKQALIEMAQNAADCDISKVEMEQLLYLLGFGNRDWLDTDQLASSLLTKIANPPPGHSVAAAQNPANRGGGVGVSARGRSTMAPGRPRPTARSTVSARSTVTR